jgi:hypothetical protein
MAASNNYFNFLRCNNLLVEHNEFVKFRNKSNYNGNQVIYFMYITGCDNSTIRHNEFHDIGFDDEGSNTTYNNTHTMIIYARADGGNWCDNLHIINNLIYNIKDWSDATAVDYKYNYITILPLAGGTDPNPGFVVANNTIDDVSEVAKGDPTPGAAKFCYGYNVGTDWIFKNTIISNWLPFSGVENGHRGFWADGSIFVTVTYSNVYNLGPVGHAQVRDYVNRMLRGVGCFGISDLKDPAYDKTPGPNYYHVTNSVLKSDDGTEMGAFGGPDGDWVAPSQG